MVFQMQNYALVKTLRLITIMFSITCHWILNCIGWIQIVTIGTRRIELCQAPSIQRGGYMKHFAFVATVALALLALPCNAVTIPYQNVGTTVPAYTVTAVNTGYIDAWFYGFSASDVDSIQVIDRSEE